MVGNVAGWRADGVAPCSWRVAGGGRGVEDAESLWGGGCGRSVELVGGNCGERWVAVWGWGWIAWLKTGDSLYGSGESPNF